MAKVQVTGLNKIKSNIRKFIIKELRNEVIRKEVGNIVANDIQSSSFGTPADSTLKWRERYEKYNNTHETYSRNKINITFTGELLDDLRNNVKVSTTQGVSYIIKQSEKLHKKYNGVNGKIGSRSKYSDIQDGIINKHGYDYLRISQEALTNVIKFINNTIIGRFRDFNRSQ